MKSDLDRLMAERKLDALLVTGSSHSNPTMYYMVNGAHVGEVTALVKKRGEEAVLFPSAMERDEAAQSGLRVISQSRFAPSRILSEEKGDQLRTRTRLLGMLLDEVGAAGRIAVYGREEQGAALALWQALASMRSGIEIVGEFNDTIFDMAWYTKDQSEVDRIRSVGARTRKVVQRTWDFLAAHAARDGVLVKDDGLPLTIGDVKSQIRRWLMEEQLESPEDFIFAIGRDAGVPHSSGDEAAPIALGQTIVYDIFPRESGGGYYFDFTRTWCVGFAPPEVEQAHGEVLEIFNITTDAMQAGAPCAQYQQMTNDYFEARGHSTLRSNPQTTEGYVHGLGHGLGLNVHERPRFSEYNGNADTLKPGVVFTVEPGLYYPERGFGVRIEDTLWLNPATNALETIGEFHKDLVISPSRRLTPRSQQRTILI